MPKRKWMLHRCFGLSLIELLISMVIGLFLLMGITNIYVGTKESDHIRDAVSHMEENARIALSTIRSIIRHAGYPSMRHLYLDAPFYAGVDDMDNPSCRHSDGSIIRGFTAIQNKKTADHISRDTVVTVSVADSPNNTLPNRLISDCMSSNISLACSSDKDNGMYSPADAKIYNYIHIDTRNGDRALRCTGSRGGTQPLADNIDSMQFLYGVIDRHGQYQYRNASMITASEQWGSVVSVQVAILVRSEKEVLSVDEEKVFMLLDQKITTEANRYLYRIYTTSIMLPNRVTHGM